MSPRLDKTFFASQYCLSALAHGFIDIQQSFAKEINDDSFAEARRKKL
jgi:hypothetical protein